MKRRLNAPRFILVIGIFILLVALVAVLVLNSEKWQARNNPGPGQIATPTVTAAPSETPVVSETPTPTPAASPEVTEPDNGLVIRTDYEKFKPNEAGDIPVIMFHNFIEAYQPDTEKDYTTTFGEFEALLQTLYDQGFRLISMQDFIDCNVSVPAGTMPMVFTFDDGTSGQFNLIKENGSLKVNPRSAVGIMMAFNQKHPDFGLKGIFYVNMDKANKTFEGEGTLRERFELLQGMGFELGTHTWGHVDYKKKNTAQEIQESLGKNQEKAEEILPGLRFYSLALPYGSRPVNESLRPYLKDGSYNGMEYHHETIMAVGANPSVPSISKKYNSLYVSRIRAQGRVAVDADLTWWLPKMTSDRMFISDGDPKTIVIPAGKVDRVDEGKLADKRLITY